MKGQFETLTQTTFTISQWHASGLSGERHGGCHSRLGLAVGERIVFRVMATERME